MCKLDGRHNKNSTLPWKRLHLKAGRGGALLSMNEWVIVRSEPGADSLFFVEVNKDRRRLQQGQSCPAKWCEPSACSGEFRRVGQGSLENNPMKDKHNWSRSRSHLIWASGQTPSAWCWSQRCAGSPEEETVCYRKKTSRFSDCFKSKRHRLLC